MTADGDGGFDVTVPPGGEQPRSRRPSDPGTYPYHCMFHSDMHGTLHVR